MKGVILYADDDVLNEGRPEKQLLDKFINAGEYTVLPVTTIDGLRDALKSVSPIRVLLLDWKFNRIRNAEDELDGANIGSQNPMKILEDTKGIFSLVYIYTRETLSEEETNKLKGLFTNKVEFRTKVDGNDVEDEYQKIKTDIQTFEIGHPGMDVAYMWSQSINVGERRIFRELDEADPNWVRVLSETSAADSGDKSSDVIMMFQRLLNEELLDDKELSAKIAGFNIDNDNPNPDSIAKLYRRFIYSKRDPSSELMTGDIFKISRSLYGVVITPECDMHKRTRSVVEVLMIRKGSFRISIQKEFSSGNSFVYNQIRKESTKENCRKHFNNDKVGSHVLPSFPFEENRYDQTALICFDNALSVKSYKFVKDHRTGYCINAPYIQQLRQRFVASWGRFGVPALPEALKEYNLIW